MGQSNWNYATGALDAATVARGVSSGFTTANGAGAYVFGFNSLDSSAGAVSLYANQTNFMPLLNNDGAATGGSIRGVVKRGLSGGPTGFAPFLFIGATGTSVSDNAYMLGLSDNNPNSIILKKGQLNSNLGPTSTGVLETGSSTYLNDVWHHLRLDMIVNPNGDVILRCFYNDLDDNDVANPVWLAVPGISDFVDDALGVNSESLPLVGGYVGFGFYTEEISRRGYFDQVQILRQV